MLPLIQQQESKECIIGAGQHYDLFLGRKALLAGKLTKQCTVTICYSSMDKTYEDHFSIDIANYMTFFSVNTYNDDVLSEMKEHTKELRQINRSIASLSRREDVKESSDLN